MQVAGSLNTTVAVPMEELVLEPDEDIELHPARMAGIASSASRKHKGAAKRAEIRSEGFITPPISNFRFQGNGINQRGRRFNYGSGGMALGAFPRQAGLLETIWPQYTNRHDLQRPAADRLPCYLWGIGRRQQVTAVLPRTHSGAECPANRLTPSAPGR